MMKTIQRTGSWDGVDPLLADPLCMREKNKPYPEANHRVKATMIVSLSPTSAMDDISVEKEPNNKSSPKRGRGKRRGRGKNKNKAAPELHQYSQCLQEETSNHDNPDSDSSPHSRDDHKKTKDDGEYYEISRDPWLESVPRKRLNRGVDCSWVDFPLPMNLVDKVKRMTNGEASYVSRRKQLGGTDPDLDLGRFKADVEQRRISTMELRYFVSDDVEFKRLQQELRERRAITDGTLKQKLHVFCRYREEREQEVRDIFSAPTSRDLDLKWRDGSLLPQAYRRMNEGTKEKAWKQFPLDPLQAPDSMSSKNSWSDRKLLKLVTNYSEKGRKAYHDEFQDEQDGMNSKLNDGVEILKYGTRDLVQIVEEDEAFKNLQVALRRTGAVTNGVLKQGLHFYVRDIRIKKGLLSSDRQPSVPEDSKDVMDGPQVTDDVKAVKKRRKLLKKLRLRRKGKSKEMVPSIEED